MLNWDYVNVTFCAVGDWTRNMMVRTEVTEKGKISEKLGRSPERDRRVNNWRIK